MDWTVAAIAIAGIVALLVYLSDHLSARSYKP